MLDLFGEAPAEPVAPARPEHRQEPRAATDIEATLRWMPDGEGEERTVRCRELIRIRDQSENGVGALIDSELPVGLSVRVVAPSLDEAGVVRHCQAVEQGYFVGVVLVKHEKRRFERLPNREPALLHLSRGTGGSDPWPVTILNATPYGVQVAASARIPDHTRVKVVHADWQCLGSVCYSKAAEDGYIAGIHLIGELFAGDSAEFSPRG